MRWLHCTALPLALLLHFVVAAEVLLVASLAEVDAEQETDALLTPAQALLRAVPASGRCAGDYKPRNRGLSASVARAAAIKLVYHAYAVCGATFQLSSAGGVRDSGMEDGGGGMGKECQRIRNWYFVSCCRALGFGGMPHGSVQQARATKKCQK